MEKKPLISVIIPIYNAEKYLEECLNSILGQTYRNLEIVLVNDGSRDSSAEICRQYRENDPRVILLEQENSGVSTARNNGVQVATGDYLMFADSDDVLSTAICETVVPSLKDFDVLAFDFESFYRAEEISEKRISERMIAPQEYNGEKWLQAMLAGDGTVLQRVNLNAVWAKIYRRDYLTKCVVKFPSEVAIGEDMLFNVQVYMNEPKIGYIPVKGYFYRTNPASVVHRYNPRFRESDRGFYEELEKILRGHHFWESFQKEIHYQKTNGFLMVLTSDIFHPDNPKSEQQKRIDFLELLNCEEYLLLISEQKKYFSFSKRVMLQLAQKKMYFQLKMLYKIKNLLRDSCF